MHLIPRSRPPARLRAATAAMGLLVALTPASPSAGQSAPDDAALRTTLQQLVPELLARHRVPGATLAVVRDGRIAFTLTFGVRRAGEPTPVNDRTVFQAASLTKPVFALGVHRLVAEGRLDPDRALTAYIDTLWVEDPRVHELTARVVLSHTTGFPNWRPGRWGPEPGPLRIGFAPGTGFQYSGEGYMYLQHVVEAITGMSLDTYLRQGVLEPLGMRDSGLVWSDRFEANHASPHDADGVPQTKRRPDSAAAAGTLQTTATDYARFLLALLSPQTGDTAFPADIDAMLEPQVRIDERLAWAAGVAIDGSAGDRVFWQWGDDGTFKAIMAGSRERRTGVVVFTNGQNGLNVARAVVERVLGAQAFLDFRMLNYR